MKIQLKRPVFICLLTFPNPIKKDACNLGKNVPKWKGFKSVRMGRAELSTKGENL